MSARFSLGMVMSRLTPNWIAEPILRDQILRCEPRQGVPHVFVFVQNINKPFFVNG